MARSVHGWTAEGRVHPGHRRPGYLVRRGDRCPDAEVRTSVRQQRLATWLVDEARHAEHLYGMHDGGPMSRDIQDISSALEGMVGGMAPSLVSVISHRMQASGFVWRAGLIVTSDEGLAEEGEVRVVLPGGESTLAQPIGRDPSTAIALLKVERADLRPVALAAAIPSPGALVLAVGAESGAPTAALGLVSVSRGSWQSMRGGEIDARLELATRLRPTAEGGLAVNAAGQAFGMTVFGPRRRVLVIPSVTIGRIAARLETQGRIPRGYLRLGLQPLTIHSAPPPVMLISS